MTLNVHFSLVLLLACAAAAPAQDAGLPGKPESVPQRRLVEPGRHACTLYRGPLASPLERPTLVSASSADEVRRLGIPLPEEVSFSSTSDAELVLTLSGSAAVLDAAELRCDPVRQEVVVTYPIGPSETSADQALVVRLTRPPSIRRRLTWPIRALSTGALAERLERAAPPSSFSGWVVRDVPVSGWTRRLLVGELVDGDPLSLVTPSGVYQFFGLEPGLLEIAPCATGQRSLSDRLARSGLPARVEAWVDLEHHRIGAFHSIQVDRFVFRPREQVAGTLHREPRKGSEWKDISNYVLEGTKPTQLILSPAVQAARVTLKPGPSPALAWLGDVGTGNSASVLLDGVVVYAGDRLVDAMYVQRGSLLPTDWSLTGPPSARETPGISGVLEAQAGGD